MIVHLGYRYRCYPTAEQIALLEDWQGKQRFLWNVANAQRIQVAQRCHLKRKQPTAVDQGYELTELRALYPWLRDVPRDVQNQLLNHLDWAWQVYNRGTAGRPEYKCKGRDRAPIIAPQDFFLEGTGRKRHVVFPKLGALPIVYHRAHKGVMKQCAITQDGDAYYVSFSCEIEVDTPASSTKPPVGCDRGVTNTIALSTGYILPNPKHAEAAEKRLKRAQRKAAKKKRGSNNQKKAYAKAGRIYRSVKRKRDHFLHVESKRLAKNHGVIVFEDLKLKNMVKSAKGTVEKPGKNVTAKSALNRGLLGAALGKFKRMVEYKAVLYGAIVLGVNPWRSSVTCAVCDHYDPDSRKGERFTCTNPKCGNVDHADVNAAKVILARGLNVLAVDPTVTVCGDAGARGRSKKQKLRVVRRGTRRKGEAKAPPLATG